VSAPDMLVVEGVSKLFAGDAGLVGKLLGRQGLGTRAVDDVSLSIRRGEMFGLVGESGCGKSTLARMIAGLIAPTQGRIALTGVSGHRPRLQMIFQDPFSSLNGRWTVGRIVAEPIRVHRLREGRAVQARVHELLEQVGLSAADASKVPQEFSGGQRQRISIARALAGEPDFLVLDEPTSALDVSVQAQILNLLAGLQRDLHLTSLFITHNLSIVRIMSDRLAVMYLGRIVEEGPTDRLFSAPRHPYTRLLMEAAPDLDTTDRSLHPIPGDLPRPGTAIAGCRFANRCPRAGAVCVAQEPPLVRGAGDEGYRCHFPLE
jgi:peptide/nickel transport system ATP-binding protein